MNDRRKAVEATLCLHRGTVLASRSMSAGNEGVAEDRKVCDTHDQATKEVLSARSEGEKIRGQC